MNKLLLIFLAFCAGASGLSAFRPAIRQARAETARNERELEASRNELQEKQQKSAALRSEVLAKKDRLQLEIRQQNLSPALFSLMDGDLARGTPMAWAELRQALGIGWDCSDQYVLVSKRVLKHLDYSKLLSSVRASDTASDILGLTPDEQASIRTVLQRAREGQWLRIERGEPGGDVLAQYTVPSPDPAFEQSASNNFFAGIIAALGQERADLVLPEAWREFKSGLAPSQPETMTIRRTTVEGEPDLICEMKSGSRVVDTSPVRYARYPSSWFLTLFPGGWQTLADREGFELPPRFRKRD